MRLCSGDGGVNRCAAFIIPAKTPKNPLGLQKSALAQLRGSRYAVCQ
jgi:hypothetical protein